MKIGITDNFSFSGNMPVFIILFINRVNDLMMGGSVMFNSLEDIPSQSQLFSAGWLAIVVFIVSLFTL